MSSQLLTNRVFGLDAMRATAILMVVFSHSLWIIPNPPALLAQLLSLFGFLGVEIFFVLSGFLIGKILYRIFVEHHASSASVISFLNRRWLRTLPNYFVVLLLNIAIAAFLGYSVEGVWRYFFFIQNFASTMPQFFPESWSLSIEEFAYLFLPISLLVVAFAIKGKLKSNIFLIVTMLLVAFSVLAKIHYAATTLNTTADQWNVSLKAVVIYRLDSIFIGVLFSWLYFNFADFWIKHKKVLAGAGVLMMMFISFGVAALGMVAESYPVFWNVVYLPMVSISIALFLPFLSQLQQAPMLIEKPITFISLISYSMYLLHYSVNMQLMKHYFNTEAFSAVQTVVFLFVYLVVVFIASASLYFAFERPLINRRKPQVY